MGLRVPGYPILNTSCALFSHPTIFAGCNAAFFWINPAADQIGILAQREGKHDSQPALVVCRLASRLSSRPRPKRARIQPFERCESRAGQPARVREASAGRGAAPARITEAAHRRSDGYHSPGHRAAQGVRPGSSSYDIETPKSVDTTSAGMVGKILASCRWQRSEVRRPARNIQNLRVKDIFVTYLTERGPC